MRNHPSEVFNQAAQVRMLAITALLSWGVLQWNLPNLGNNLIPRNFFVAALMCLACASGWIHVLAQGRIRWTPAWGLLFIPPMVIGLHAIWVPVGSFPHYPWLVGLVLALMAGLALGLSQLALTRSQWLSISRIWLFGTSLLCLITLLSPPYLAWDAVWLSLPLPLRAAHGGFQQPNLLASFLATSILFALWLQLSHASTIKGWRAMGMLSLTALHVFIVFKSGSRVGMLGLAISMLLLGLWTHRFSPQNRRMGWWCFISLLMAALLAAWLGDVIPRLRDLNQGSSTHFRLSFIQASIHLWWQSPWWGHGLGTFSEQIVPVFVELIEGGKSLHYTPNLGHPHNEVLLWAVETGTVGVISIVGPWVFVLAWFCRQQAWSSLAWVACLLPISLHQLTEFPFHSSTAHIWLWCMVWAAGMPSPEWRPVPWVAIKWVRHTGITAICVLACGATWMLVDTGWVSYQAWKHRPGLIQLANTQASLPMEREFHHPVMKTFATDQFNALNASRLIAAKGDMPISGLCDDILEMGKRWQNPNQWASEGECLRARGHEPAILSQQRKVNALTRSP